MARFSSIALFIAAAASAASAQSAKTSNALPAPSPPVAAPIPFEAASYSESKPGHRKPASPTLAKTADASGLAVDPESGQAVVKVVTTIVTIPVSVYDQNGLYISDLQQSDFEVFENGKQQSIAYFGTDDKPFTVVLLLDTSPSTTYKIDEIRKAAVAFVDQLKPVDKVMVIEFDGNVHVLTEATSDRKRLNKAIGDADFGGGTSLYDAVDFSLKKRLDKISGRKAVVLFTDGVDTTSHKADYDTTLARAERSDALIFPIYYNTFDENKTGGGSSSNGSIFSSIGTRPQDYALGMQYLYELADYTGGSVFRPDATTGGLAAAFKGIAEELRRQYNIGYVPNTVGMPGERKLIKVRVGRPNLVIKARDSYIVGATRETADRR